MLERKRLLKVKEQLVREGRRVFVYEHPKSGDLFTIADPGLQLNQLESVQRDVAALLEHGLNPPAPGQGAPPVPAQPSPAETGEPCALPPSPQAPEPPQTSCRPPPGTPPAGGSSPQAPEPPQTP